MKKDYGIKRRNRLIHIVLGDSNTILSIITDKVEIKSAGT